MQITPEITFRDVDRTDDLDDLVQTNIAALEDVCGYITRARVAVEHPHEHPRRGSSYRIRIDLTVPPGHEVVVVRKSSEGSIRDDVYTVIQEAFDAARRRLLKLVEIQRDDVKLHPEQQVQGFVIRLFADHGFLRSVNDGQEVYFHKNSLLDQRFSELRLGMGVAFNVEEGRKGPQATSVRVVDSRGLPPESLEQISP